MMGPVGPWMKRTFSRAAGVVSGRQICVLAPEARDDGQLLDARAAYRAANGRVHVEVLERRRGTLQATLLGYVGHQPTRELWSASSHEYSGPSRVSLNLHTGDVTLNETVWGRVEPARLGRRFCFHLRHTAAGGVRERLTSHYRVDAGGNLRLHLANFCERPASRRSQAAR
jgi:hypothetical protein